MRVALLTAVLLAASASAQPALVAQPALGETSFANSGLAQAQEPFLRGLLLLHSFEYDDAREAFQQAREIDPGFAMAAWGEAMTHNHPVWQQQDRDAAQAALAGLASETMPRERDYLAALAVLFGDGDKQARDDRYADAMRQLAERYPDDLDARAFYALALLGTSHEGRDFTTYMKAAAVAEDVFAENPRHPGAAHYLIHAYDDPVHAPLGLRPARVYAEIAPSASHALHMPSHIYLALGLWPETAAMNERSYLAAKAGTDRRAEPLNGHGWHALWWWHYAATQLGDTDLARQLLRRAFVAAGDHPDETARAHIARIRAQHVFGADDVSALAAAADEAAPPFTFDSVYDAYTAGVLAASAGDADVGRAAVDAVAVFADEPDARWSDRAAALQVEGLFEQAQGNPAAALDLLRQAAEIEAAAPLAFGPPAPVVPSHEVLGFVLLDMDRPAEAAIAFQAALARAPGRRQSVAGLAAAQAAQ